MCSKKLFRVEISGVYLMFFITLQILNRPFDTSCKVVMANRAIIFNTDGA